MENFEITKNKYYIRLNEKNQIIKTFSSTFEKPNVTDILIGEGEGSQFRAFSNNLSPELKEFTGVENGLQLTNEHGIYILKYENGLICKVSEEELLEELNNLPKPQPTEVELLKEENLNLMETMTMLYERSQDLEQQNIDLMVAITELYEMNI